MCVEVSSQGGSLPSRSCQHANGMSNNPTKPYLQWLKSVAAKLILHCACLEETGCRTRGADTIRVLEKLELLPVGRLPFC